MKLPKCQDIPKQFWYPEGAVEKELNVFRLTINKDKVCADDFLSKFELDTRRGKDTTRLAGIDEYYGLSVLEDYRDAQRLLAKVKAKKELQGISAGVTADGLVRNSPRPSLPSHVTWWPYDDATPEMHYIIVARGDENE